MDYNTTLRKQGPLNGMATPSLKPA